MKPENIQEELNLNKLYKRCKFNSCNEIVKIIFKCVFFCITSFKILGEYMHLKDGAGATACSCLLKTILLRQIILDCQSRKC